MRSCLQIAPEMMAARIGARSLRLGEMGLMSYTTSHEARVRVIHALCEGASVNGAARQTGVSKPTILKALVQVGTGAVRVHNRVVRELSSVQIQADEIWSYVGKKERRVTENDPPGVGEAYTFVAIDVDTRLVLSYLVGRRDSESTAQFINDMRSRLTVMPQIVTDGFAPYVEAVLSNFGASVNYAMVNKHFRSKPRPDDEIRYEPPRGVWLTKQVISGAPDMGKATTVHIESQNRTIRTHVRRLTRLSNGFSKKRENHCAALALHFLYYNFVKVHSELKTTPAVAAKLTDRPWTAAELVAACLAEPEAPKPVAVPLALPEGYSGAARELPGGRGWLRIVPKEGNVAPANLTVASPSSEEERQLDLLEWFAARPAKPLPPIGTQLSLFDSLI